MKIIKRENLSVGGVGTISKIKALFTKKTQKGKIIRKNKDFVIKQFPNEKICNHSYKIWETIKELKLPTYTTYRKIENNQILMTNLSTKKQFTISVNNNSEDSIVLVSEKINQIPNFTEFIENSIIIIKKLSQNNIFLIPYTYFILIDKNKSNIQLFIGDFDFVETNKHNCEKDNFINFYTTIDYFLEMFVVKEKQEEYLTILYNLLVKYM